jgi:hypothetical protein
VRRRSGAGQVDGRARDRLRDQQDKDEDRMQKGNKDVARDKDEDRMQKEDKDEARDEDRMQKGNKDEDRIQKENKDEARDEDEQQAA